VTALGQLFTHLCPQDDEKKDEEEEEKEEYEKEG